MAERKDYTPAEKQKYFNALAKKGSVLVTKKGVTPLTDFRRGFYKAKADEIAKARKRTWKKHHPNG